MNCSSKVKVNENESKYPANTQHSYNLHTTFCVCWVAASVVGGGGALFVTLTQHLSRNKAQRNLCFVASGAGLMLVHTCYVGFGGSTRDRVIPSKTKLLKNRSQVITSVLQPLQRECYNFQPLFISCEDNK